MLKLTDVSKYYRSENTITLGLHKINLEFEKGDFVAITGESGSGKSTLLNVLSGSDSYNEGELYIGGEETSYYDESDWENYRKEKIGFIYQNYNLIDSFSVLQNVKTAIYIIHPDIEQKEADEKAMYYLEKVGLKKQAGKKATHLSSGQKQRLSIARALAKETDIIVADEPTGNLDSENSRQMIEILSQLSKDRLVLMVTHNYDEAQPYATRKIRMYHGEVAEDIRLRPRREQTQEVRTKKQLTAKAEKKEQKTLAKRMAKTVRRAKPHNQLVLLMLFFFLFTSIYIFFGTFMKNLDFSTAKEYSKNTYAVVNDKRLSVKKEDGSVLTSEDVEKLREIAHVTSVDLYDTVNDISYVWEKGEDYYYTDRTIGTTGNVPDKRIVEIKDDSKMLRTETVLTEKDILSGKMPEKKNDIVVCSDDKSLIGQEKDIYFYRKNNWQKERVYMRAVISGVTDVGEEGQLYISEEQAKILTSNTTMMSDVAFYGIYGEDGEGIQLKGEENQETNISEFDLIKKEKIELSHLIVLPDESLSDEQVWVSEAFFKDAYVVPASYSYIRKLVQEEVYLFYGPASNRQSLTFLLADKEDTKNTTQVILVSPNVYAILRPNQESHQISVYMEDYAYTDRVMKKIEEQGYQVISTYRAGSMDYNWDIAEEQTNMLMISLVAFVAVFLLGIFMIQILMNTRKKDYHIMILMGMNRSVIDRVSLIDITKNAITALIAMILAVNISLYFETPFIASAVRYYEWQDYLIYMSILFVMMLLLYRRVRLVRRKSVKSGEGRGKQ